MKKPITAICIVALMSAFSYLVWPTPYSYTFIRNKHGAQAPIRINRITGEGEMLISIREGWIGRDKPKKKSKTDSTSPPKLDVSGLKLLPVKEKSK